MPEKEYIEREAVVERINNSIRSWSRDYNSNAPRMVSAYKDVLFRIQSVPTADVVEVKHAYWHDIYLITPWVATGICSACKTLSYINPDFPYFKRCPECGALMDDWERKTEAERLKIND